MLWPPSAVEMLAERGMKGAQALLDLVAPSWVRAEDAKPIAELAMSEGPKRGFGLHATGFWSRASYISRSCLKSLTYQHKVCQLQKQTKRDTLADYREQIIDCFMIKGPFAQKGDREKVLHQIEEMAKEKPVFVVFPPEFVPDSTLIRKLKREFKTVTFFVLTGKARQEQLRPLRAELDFLRPPDPALEERTRWKYDDVKTSLSGSSPV